MCGQHQALQKTFTLILPEPWLNWIAATLSRDPPGLSLKDKGGPGRAGDFPQASASVVWKIENRERKNGHLKNQQRFQLTPTNLNQHFLNRNSSRLKDLKCTGFGVNLHWKWIWSNKCSVHPENNKTGRVCSWLKKEKDTEKERSVSKHTSYD